MHLLGVKQATEQGGLGLFQTNASESRCSVGVRAWKFSRRDQREGGREVLAGLFPAGLSSGGISSLQELFDSFPSSVLELKSFPPCQVLGLAVW